jgi:glycosyltransferase involved in cell wall biosynthesis
VAAHPRVLHASLVPRISQGIAQQLLLEDAAARELGLPWTTALFTPHSDLQPLVAEINRAPSSLTRPTQAGLLARLSASRRMRQAFYAWLAEVAAEFDIILLRYSVHDLAQRRFVAHCPAMVGLVHHSFEVEELRGLDGAIGRVRAMAEGVIGPTTLRNADLIVGVTQEIADHQVARAGRGDRERIIYPNGGLDSAAPVADERGGTPELLFIASEFSPWQGLDLLLASLPRLNRPFTLHLVGDVSAPDAREAGGDARVVLHGQLASEQIRGIATRCWLGISSLAIQRQGFRIACPLKVREYLAMGLPVVGGHGEVLPDDFAYYRRIRADIAEVLNAADHWRDLSRAQVADASVPLISKRSLVSSTFAELSHLWQGRTA